MYADIQGRYVEHARGERCSIDRSAKGAGDVMGLARDVGLGRYPAGLPGRSTRFFHGRIAVLLAITPLILSEAASAQVIDQDREYKLKAAFLCGFCRYITWRSATTKVGGFKIAVLGKSPVCERLKRFADEHDVKGRDLEVTVASSAESVCDCHILFIPKEVPNEQVVTVIRGLSPNTIVVGERAGLAELGASVVFFVEGKAVCFELLRQSLARKNVRVDAKLLRLSRSCH